MGGGGDDRGIADGKPVRLRINAAGGRPLWPWKSRPPPAYGLLVRFLVLVEAHSP